MGASSTSPDSHGHGGRSETPTETRRTVHDPILKEAGRIEDDAQTWAQAHARARTHHGRWGAAIGIAAVVAASTASVTGFGEAAPALVGIFGAAAAALSAIQGFWRPEERTSDHHQAAACYRELAAEARLFCEYDFAQMSSEERRAKLDMQLRDLTKLEREWPWVSHGPLYDSGKRRPIAKRAKDA